MNISIPVNIAGRKENRIFIPKGQTLTTVLNNHNDNFNGTVLNPVLWTKDIPSASFISGHATEIVNNRLVLSGTSINSTSNSTQDVASNFYITGDFDIQVDVEIGSGTAGKRVVGLETYFPAPGFGTYLHLWEDGQYRVQSTLNTWNPVVVATSPPTSFTLRSTKVGNVLTSYYSLNGGEWVVIDTRSTGITDYSAWIHLRSQVRLTLGTFSNAFDNFKVNSGTIDFK